MTVYRPEDRTAQRSRELATRLFEYLQKLAELRTRPIRDLDEYAETLWFDQIPPEPECRIVTGAPPADPLTWISIDRPRDVRPPSLPEALAQWVDQQELQDAAADPQLRDEADGVDSGHLHEHPEVQASWARYRTAWDRWAAEHRRLEPVVDAYKQLFEIEQLGSQLGEQYETVIGLGLLNWSGPAGAIRRHLLTMPAQVRFEAETGQITVGVSLEGTRLRFEEDMLEGDQRPSRDLVRSLESRLEQLRSEPWDRVTIDAVLQAWVNAAHTRGLYDPGLTPLGRGDDFPKVTFAPSLILRRRTQRSLVEFYARVLEQLRDGQAAVPPTIRDVVEILDDDQQEQDDAWGDDDGEVYFPLPANDEQQRIVERLARHRGVVVQGPPGTGKSHTIANLITHLLASGKRVLVTSHTARALRVLKDKLPEDIADLCVSVADEGRRGVGELERSVQALLARAEDSRWQDHAIAERVDRLRRRLRENEEQRRALLDRQRAIREREIDIHRPPFGDYGGTLARISERLRFEEPSYGWLRERPDGPAPLGDKEALELLHLLRTVGEDAVARAHQRAPDQTDVAAPSQVAGLLDELHQAERAADEFQTARALPMYLALSAAPVERRGALAEAVARLVWARDEVLRGREPWLPTAVAAVLDGRTFEWVDLARQTFDGLARLGDDPTAADRVRLQGHEGFHPGALREQARSLGDHLAAGGRIGGLLKAAPVRAAQPMLATVRVDGLPPDNLERLRSLICVLDTDAYLAALERQWGSMLPAANEASYSARAMRLGQAASVLNTAFELSGPRGVAEAAAQAIAGLVPPTWSDPGQIESLRRCLAAVEAEEAAAALRGDLEAVARPLRSVAISGSAAPECTEAVRALEAHDVAAYANAVAGLDELYRTWDQVHHRDLLLERLHTSAPGLARELENDPGASDWDHRLADLERAWNWARADTWYRRLVEAGDERDVEERLRACDERSLKLTGELAANLAWRHCLRRMTSGESMHLRAYQQAMRRYGKGTGKYAGTHLIEAQRHMDACQGAVPAWIMPAYRVAETISPRPHAFDVVIVDEASQSGVDALFLLWLAPKIVIVGDDRQISPDNVGMPHDIALRYQNEYLGGVELRDVLGLDHSLFDQAATRYRGRIWLREHFRCMPEIIEYSNRLSYPDHRLVPLREFGTDRLPPLKAVHVQGASVRGTSDSRKVNEAEAEAIVEQIAKCCADSAYDGRSMGVISLLGDAQAHRIRNLLVERIGPEEMVARRIKCGNAYDFQGDERNAMFLSMVVTPTPDGRRLPALGRKEFVQRFNVAASRAEDQMWLFHSVQLHDLNPECVRWKLLDHCLNPPSALAGRDVGEVRPDILREPFDSLFEQRVYLRLREREYTVIPQYEVHNFRIDLVVVGERARLAVECDGEAWHGPEQYARDVARQRDLERCGWRFFRLRESEFYRDPDAALTPLWNLLKERGIWPRSHEPEPTQIESVEPVPVGPVDAPAGSAFGWFGSQEPRQAVPTSPLAIPEPPTKTAPHVVPAANEAEDESDREAEEDLDEAPWLEAEEDEQLILVETSTPNPLGLDPYISWEPTPQPDPRSASRETLIEGLARIVAIEGPIVARRAYRLLLRASGGQRLAKLTRAPLNRAAAAAVRRGILADENPSGRQTQIDRVLRLPGSPEVRIRARGDRTLPEIPMSEVAALMRRLRAENPRLSAPELRREVLDAYGLVRMTAKVLLYLDECIARSFEEPTP